MEDSHVGEQNAVWERNTTWEMESIMRGRS